MNSPDASAATTVGSRGTGPSEPDSYADLLVGLWSCSRPRGGRAKDSNFGHTSWVPRANSLCPCLSSVRSTLKASLRVAPTIRRRPKLLGRGHPTRCGAWPFFCVVALFAGTARPAERRYPIFPLRGKVTLDGKLDEPAWQGAPWAGDFLPLRPGEQIQQTRFKILYDASALYLGVAASERYIDARRTDRGDGERVWQDDSLELFFQARAGGKYCRVGVNAAGRRSDTRVRAHASHKPAAYVLEIAIPFSVLGATVTPGTLIRGNICRNCLTTRDGKHSTWAPLDAQFHEPQNFAELHIRPEPVSLAQVTQIEGLVNVVHSPTFLRGARRTAETYKALLSRAASCKLSDRDQVAIVKRWERERHGALRYMALFDYLTQKGSNPSFWQQDHSDLLAQGPCPAPGQYLRPVTLSREEQALDYRCRLEQLLKRADQ